MSKSEPRALSTPCQPHSSSAAKGFSRLATAALPVPMGFMSICVKAGTSTPSGWPMLNSPGAAGKLPDENDTEFSGGIRVFS